MAHQSSPCRASCAFQRCRLLLLLSLLLSGAHATTSTFDPVGPARIAYAQQQSSNRVHFASKNATTTSLATWISNAFVQQQHRLLQEGDFDAFNKLFDGAWIELPDTQVTQDTVFATLVIDLKGLTCRNIRLTNIDIAYQGDAATLATSAQLPFTITVAGLSLDCSGNYAYAYGLFNGEGSMDAFTNENRLDVTLSLHSPDTFPVAPPSSATVDSCNAAMDVTHMDFHGGVVAGIADLFQGLISGAVEGAVNNVACAELTSLGPTFLQDTIDMVQKEIDVYLQPLSPERANPLYAEENMAVPEGVTLINFQRMEENATNTTSDNGQQLLTTLLNLLQQFSSSLGETVEDVGGPTGTNSDLALNVFLRANLLNEERALVLNLQDLPMNVSNMGVLFNSHDMLTETTLTLHSIKILGLDTIKSVTAMNPIGKYTLQNAFSWDFLQVVANLTVDIKPSSLPDAILKDVTPTHLIETIQIAFGVDELTVDLATLLAIDETKLLSLQVGSLLHSENILDCVLSVLHHSIEITKLNVFVRAMEDPVLSGFISPGIDRVVSSFVEIAFLAYEPTFVKALPNLFQIMVRDILQEQLLDSFLDEPASCPAPVITDEWIDFRDLLLTPTASLTMGGSGQEPYGDVAYQLMDLLKAQFFGKDEATGQLFINTKALTPMTLAQSGYAGMVHFPDDLFALVRDDSAVVAASVEQAENKDIVATLAAAAQATVSPKRFEFKLSDLRLYNLDTVAEPLSLLNCTNTSHRLDNEMNMATQSEKQLAVAIRLFMAMEEGPFDGMLNQMDLSLQVGSLELQLLLHALVSSPELLQFPIGHVMDVDCWLAMMPSVAELQSTPYAAWLSSLSAAHVWTQLSQLSIKSDCISCTSPGLQALPNILTLLDQTGASYILGTRMGSFLAEFVQNPSMEHMINEYLAQSPQLCPISPQYDAAAVRQEAGMDFPSLSAEAVDTILYSGVMATQVLLAVLAENFKEPSVDALPDIPSLEEEAPQTVVSASNAPPGRQLQQDGGSTLLDWTDIGGSLGTDNSFPDEAFAQAREFITGVGDDGVTLRINALLQDLLLDANRTWNMQPAGMKMQEGNVTFAVDRIQVRGLDTFTLFNILEPQSSRILNNQVNMKHLELDLTLSLGDRDTMPAGPQQLNISLGVHNISLHAPVLAVFDLEKVWSLELGQLMHISHILPCLLSTAAAIELPQLVVRVDQFDKLVFKGLHVQTGDTAKASMDLIMQEYETAIIQAIPNMFNETVRAILNNMVNYYLTQPDNVSCPKLVVPPTTAETGRNLQDTTQQFIDLRDLMLSSAEALAYGGMGGQPYGDLVQTSVDLLKRELLQIHPETGLSMVNDVLIARFTEAQSGEAGLIQFEGDLLNTGARIQVGGLDARVVIRAYDAYIDNLDSMGPPLSLLDAVNQEPHLLNNTASIGVSRAVRLGVRFQIALIGDDEEIDNDLNITVDLEQLTLVVTGLLKLAQDNLLTFPVRDIMNMNCWMANFPAPPLDERGVRLESAEPSLAIADLAATVKAIGLNVTCNNCSSPGMAEFTALLATPEAAQGATEVANQLLDYAAGLLGGPFLQVKVDRMLNDAARACPHNPMYDVSETNREYAPFEADPVPMASVSFFMAILIAAGCLIVIVLVVVLVTKCIVKRRSKKWVQTLPKDKVLVLWKLQHEQQLQGAALDEQTKSLFTSPDVPCWVRFFIPVVIIGNIGFFLSGHLSLGASVNIVATLADQTFTADKFFEFSMAKSTIEIWNAGGKELAILILLFSGIWPYTKQLMTLVLWFTPPRWVSVGTRGSTFRWLDVLAKWSMVDIFVLVVTVAGFRVSVQSPDVPFLPDGFYSLDLLVQPKWGLFANMIAQLISQLSSHYIIHYHDRIVEQGQLRYEQEQQQQKIMPAMTPATVGTTSFMFEDDEEQPTRGEDVPAPASIASGTTSTRLSAFSPDQQPEQLCNHAFARPHRGEGDRLVARRLVTPVLCIFSLTACILIILGVTLPAFSIEILGMIGVMVESGQEFESAKTYHSLFTMIKMLFDQAAFTGSAADYVGLGSLSILLVFSVLLVPIAQIGTLLWQWFRPVTPQTRHRLSVSLEILQAWQYAEVFLIAVLIASWQLGPVSDFMVNEYCGALDATFAQLVFFGILDPRDAQCFRVEATVEAGSILLLVFAILLAFVNTFVMKAVAQYFRDQHKNTALVSPSAGDAETFEVDEEEEEEKRGEITPTPVLFTDAFRWMLLRQDVASGSDGTMNHPVDASLTTASVVSKRNADEENSPYLHERQDPSQSMSLGEGSESVIFSTEDQPVVRATPLATSHDLEEACPPTISSLSSSADGGASSSTRPDDFSPYKADAAAEDDGSRQEQQQQQPDFVPYK